MAGHLELEQRIRRIGYEYEEAVPPTPDLERRVMARIAIPTRREPAKPTLRHDLALAGTLILFVAAVAIGVTELRTNRQAVHTNLAMPTAQPTASVKPTPSPLVPADDLHIAGLATELVTPLDIQATDQGLTARLVGGYADAARIVLIYHMEGATTPITIFRSSVMVDDDQGLVNGGGSTNYARSTGDAISVIEAGPHPGADGLAHLTIQLTSWKQGNGPGQVRASWNFSIVLPIYPSTPVPAPNQFQLGRWKANIEVLEVTPTVVHLQAVINGATPVDIGLSTVTLLDPAGNIIGQGCGAGITVPKTQIDSPNSPLYHNARVYCEFTRPSEPGTYRLRFAGGGGTYTIQIPIKAPLPARAKGVT
ncbi:MAG TPA: hypothetical protein VFR68_06680 [Candidatus Dormibacteraeota bacterium]|nr:hypothetical protein [Candidatus Dormibacteraeota bacterium]